MLLGLEERCDALLLEHLVVVGEQVLGLAALELVDEICGQLHANLLHVPDTIYADELTRGSRFLLDLGLLRRGGGASRCHLLVSFVHRVVQGEEVDEIIAGSEDSPLRALHFDIRVPGELEVDN